MNSPGVLRIIVLCFTMACWSKALESKRITTLKAFREYYASLAETCKTVGYEKGQCHTRKVHVVAFSATMTNHQDKMRKGTVVKFPNVILNEGGGYDGQSSTFTAPVRGVYVFHWTILTRYAKYVYTGLQANGKNVINQHCNNPTKSSQLCSTMSIIKLKKGEKVWIQIFQGHDSNAYGLQLASHFSGYKM